LRLKGIFFTSLNFTFSKRPPLKFLTAFAFIFLTLSSSAQSFQQLNEEFMGLFQKGEYQSAIPVGEKAILQSKKEFGEKHLNYAIANHNLAEAYYALQRGQESFPYYKTAIKTYKLFETNNGADLGLCYNSIGTIFLSQKKYDSAARNYEIALAYFLKLSEENYDNLIVVMNNLSDIYLPLGQNKEAQSLYERVLPVIKKKETTKSTNYYVILSNLAAAYHSQQLLMQAEKSCREVASIIEELKGTNNTEYTDILDQLANTVREQGRPKEAEELITKAYQIKKSFPGFDTLAIVTSYNAYGNVYTDLAEFSKAEDYFKQALSLLNPEREDHVDWFQNVLRNFGYSYIEAGNFPEAKKILLKVLQLQQQKFGADYPENAMVIVTIANAEFQLDEYSEAEKHAKEAMELLTKVYGKENFGVARSYEILGLIYHKTGRSKEALNYYLQAININTKLFGEQSRAVAYNYSNFGLIYFDLSKFAQAELALSEAYRIQEKIFGPDHTDCALSLANIGVVYLSQARYADADRVLAIAVNIYKKRGLTQTPNFLKVLNTIALLSTQQGNYDEAKKLFFNILQTIKEQEQKNSTILFIVLNNLSLINIQEKKYDSALYYASQAAEMAKNFFGTATTDYVKSMSNLMVANSGAGNLKEAEAIFKDLVPLCKQVLGDKAPLLNQIYFNGAFLSFKKNEFSSAKKYIDSSNRLLFSSVEQDFLVLSEKEKLEWWNEFRNHFDLQTSILLKANNDPSFLENFANNQLNLKGYVLNDASLTFRRARQNGSSQLKEAIDKWETTRKLLSKEQLLPANQRKYSLDSLEIIANALEKNINILSSEALKYRKETGNWKEIQNALSANEAAIEFLSFRLMTNVYTDSVKYAALLFTKDSPLPQFISLCDEAALSYCLKGGKENDKETNINALYRSSITSSKNTGKFLGDSLYNLIWKPLLPYLKNTSTIFFAPDGILHKVAFHALPTPDKKLLIDNYQLQQFSSIRQIVNSKNKKPKALSSVFLLGNPNFNPATSNTAGNSNNTRGSWTQLPGTEKEINQLKQVFQSKGTQVVTKTGDAATEESFKNQDGRSSAIAHLATHGFFLQQAKPDSLKKQEVRNPFILSNDPLIRSGLILTGANSAWNGQQQNGAAEDGVLTAFEIAQMDLSNTQLVVLSACETALGDLQGSEGVFGLQRAFKIAGVKNMVVSLWQVPDKETVELMTSFYTNLLGGKNVRDAFYQAQKEMRSKYPPFYWAAFVLVE
jgi:CHAT domain-containing protein/tetratricopeptide (TPR) repeat protein